MTVAIIAATLAAFAAWLTTRIRRHLTRIDEIVDRRDVRRGDDRFARTHKIGPL